MKLLFALSLCFSLILCGDRYATKVLQANRVGSYEAKYISAKIDNFNPYDERTYKQRYYINYDEWNKDPNAPIFLEIGGEGAITGPASGNEEIAVLAREHGGIIMALEHRFYGASMPFDDLSLESIKYLDDRQALEDVANFINFIDEELHPDDHVPGNPKNKWVLIGGSYPGALSSWMRLKYPQLSKCSLSSSGVVEAIYKFESFDHQIYLSAGDLCANIMRLVTGEMEKLVEQQSTRIKLFAKFGADANYDIGDFFYYMADSGVMAIQYGHTNELCGRLEDAYNTGSDIIDAYASYVMDWLNIEMNTYGADTYDRRVMVDESLPDEGYISRQWQYQTCSRLSWFQSAPQINSIRSKKYLQFDYFLDLCKDVFGIEMDPEVDNVNNFYGGKETKATNVFYANFWQDPWHLASPTDESLDDDLGSELMLVKCNDCGHCQDMHEAKDSDPPELTEVRERIKDFVNRCLAE